MLIVSSFSSQPSYHHHPYIHHHRGHACRDQLFVQQRQGLTGDFDGLFASLQHQSAHQQQLHHALSRQRDIDALVRSQRQRQLQLITRRRQQLAQEFEQRRQVAIEAHRQQHLQQQRASHDIRALVQAMEALFSQSQTIDRETLPAEAAGSAQIEPNLKRTGAVRRARFDKPAPSATTPAPPTASTSIPVQVPSPQSTSSGASSTQGSSASHGATYQPSVAVTVPSSPTMAEPVRIPVLTSQDNDEVPSHIHINDATPPVPPAGLPPTSSSAADARATLNLLSSNLDDYLSSSRVWPSPAHRIHALNKLLEQVDAVESDGEDAIREARRGLVRKVEQALDGQQGLEKLVQTEVLVTQNHETNKTAGETHQGGDATSTELVGYDVPDLGHATPLATSTPIASPASAGTILPPTTVPGAQSGWSTSDPTSPQPLGLELVDEDDSTPATAAEAPRPLAVEAADGQMEPVFTSPIDAAVGSSGIIAAAEEAPVASPTLAPQEKRAEAMGPSSLEIIAGVLLAASETSSPAVSRTNKQEEADLAEWESESESEEDAEADADAFELV